MRLCGGTMDIFLLLSFVSVLSFSQATLSKRFEYKYSFKGPHLVQKDRTVPFWTYIGNAIASDDFVRLAPSLKSQRGLIWNKIETSFDNWEVEITFKVAGRGRVGADGLAFWYTMEKEGMTGSVFGSRDNWNGLGVFFDSFDNDAQNNNPYISAQLNDGSRKFDHHTDGSLHQLGGCMRDYRNKPYPVRAKIRYENKVLTIHTSSGLTKVTEEEESEHMYDLCAYITNVELARGGHFSVSAATGGLADDHDIMSFLTHSLRTEEEMKSKQAIAEEERARYDKEFEEYDKQLNEAKDEYQKANPDATEKPHEEEYMDNDMRELRMIFEGQEHIHNSINAINKRLSELLGVSQQVSAQIAQLQQAGGAVAPSGGTPAAPPAAGQTIQRHEVDQLIRTGNDLMLHIGNLKVAVEGLARDKPNQPGKVPQFADTNIHQTVDTINEVKLIVKQMQADAYAQKQVKAVAGDGCPETNCVSTVYFGAFIVMQIVVFLLYNVYTSRKEASAKKFY
ncbi:protein ERGIC-53-like [Watersipora subatra]|uniref:protein ERGIC-53-like n=1 Tax=Watersipora subatra TaxID=2589382 RepID=UPI00355B8833